MPGDQARSLLTLKSAYSKVVLGPVQLPTGHHRKSESLGSGQNRHGVGPQAIFEASFGALEVLQVRHVFSYLRSCLRSNLWFLTLRSSPTQARQRAAGRPPEQGKRSARLGLSTGCHTAPPNGVDPACKKIPRRHFALGVSSLSLSRRSSPRRLFFLAKKEGRLPGRPKSHWGQCVSDYPW